MLMAAAGMAEERTTRISLSDTAISIEGAGATYEGSTVTITRAGAYHITGALSDGQIRVDANGGIVELILDGARITCATSAPIYSLDAEETIITLSENSINTLRDGSSYVYPDETTDEPDAALFAKDDLRIRGTGALDISASYQNGIGTKDALVIEGGSISIDAVNHGIRGRDAVTVTGGALAIVAGNDGIQSNNDERDDAGWIAIEGGAFSIQAGHDGIQAETSLSIANGDFAITAGGGHAATGTSEESYKGLKAAADIAITGGTFTVDSLDDALHANGSIAVEGGRFTLSTGDDGIHADQTIDISGGEIHITDSYEGIESMAVNISGGTIHIVSRDDGINMSDGSVTGGNRFGPGGQQASDSLYLNMSGGWVSIDASSDGVDSNGNILMREGTLLINALPSGDGPALDFDGSFALTGGILAGAGSSGMAMAPGEGSTQPSLMVAFSQVQAAGTPFYLLDEAGSLVMAYTPAKAYGSIVISGPALSLGQTLAAYSGGTSVGEGSDGLVLDGSASGGTKLFSITLESVTTSVDQTGAAVGGNGRGRRGGF